MQSLLKITARALRTVYGCWIHTPPILDADKYFPEARELEKNWRVIREEAIELLKDIERIPRLHELLKDQARISANDPYYWRLFILRAYGSDQTINQTRCPETTRLIRSIPNITSAAFSLLECGKHIPAHRGPYRGILRYHLALIVPLDRTGNPACVLRLADQRYFWREGDGLLWDDTYEHEVWNNGRGPRVVLLLDVKRRGMASGLQVIHNFLYESVARSKSLQRVLEKSKVPVDRI